MDYLIRVLVGGVSLIAAFAAYSIGVLMITGVIVNRKRKKVAIGDAVIHVVTAICTIAFGVLFTYLGLRLMA